MTQVGARFSRQPGMFIIQANDVYFILIIPLIYLLYLRLAYNWEQFRTDRAIQYK